MTDPLTDGEKVAVTSEAAMDEPVERLPELLDIGFDDLFVPDPAPQATSSGSVRRR